MDAFDADALIYAASPAHPLGEGVRRALASPGNVGSVLLLPEVLAKPIAGGWTEEADELRRVLALLDLQPVDVHVAEVATVVAACYRLRAADAVHLATAVVAGADRFITNNRDDFPRSIAEIDVTYPVDLA